MWHYLAMSVHEKNLARMRNNPRDWRIDDLKTKELQT